MQLTLDLVIPNDLFAGKTYVILPKDADSINAHDLYLIDDEEGLKRALYFQIQAWTAAMATNIESLVIRKIDNNDYDIYVNCLLRLTDDNGKNISDEMIFWLHHVKNAKEQSS